MTNNKSWHSRHPDYMKKWRAANPGYGKKWHDAHPDYMKNYRLARGMKPRGSNGQVNGGMDRSLCRRFVDAVKLYYCCTNPDCKWDGPFEPGMLEFHHIDRSTKQNNIALMVGRQKLQTIAEEMNKCCVLCSNCHRLERAGKLDCSSFTRCNITPTGEVVGIV